MLEVKINLNPFGQENIKNLGTMFIANDDMTDDGLYNYMFILHEPSPLFGKEVLCGGFLLDYDREQAASELVGACFAVTELTHLHQVKTAHPNSTLLPFMPEKLVRLTQYLIAKGKI